MVSSRESSVSAEFERECVAFFAGVVGVLGVPPSVGQIYGLLFASPEPLSFTDILEVLNASKGSVSQGLNFLREVGAVRAVEKVGDRREYFEPELGLRRLMSGVVRERVAPLTETGAKRIGQLKQLAIVDDTAGKFYRSRVKQLETWRKQLRIALPLLNTLLGPGGRR